MELDDHPPDRPQNKQDLNDIRGRYGNNQTLAHIYYADTALQYELKILYLAARPIMQAYRDTLESHKLGQAGLKLAAANNF